MSQYNDFIGFTFNNCHSSDLNLKRVSDGSRYTDNLLPSFQDKTIQVGGRDGVYLFGSQYQTRDFVIQTAFSEVDEIGLRKIQNWGADKKIHQLIFDETPYKAYNVKLASPPEIKYVCFDEYVKRGSTNDNHRRIYKGECTFKFICYEPYARGTIKSTSEILNDEISEEENINNSNGMSVPEIYIFNGGEEEDYTNIYHNLNEWKSAIGLPESADLDGSDDGYYEINNCGDIPMPLKIYIDKDQIGNEITIQLQEKVDDETWIEVEDRFIKLNIPSNTLFDEDHGIIIDSELQLITGYDENKNRNNNIYNRYIIDGDFFTIPVGDFRINGQTVNATDIQTIELGSIIQVPEIVDDSEELVNYIYVNKEDKVVTLLREDVLDYGEDNPSGIVKENGTIVEVDYRPNVAEKIDTFFRNGYSDSIKSVLIRPTAISIHHYDRGEYLIYSLIFRSGKCYLPSALDFTNNFIDGLKAYAQTENEDEARISNGPYQTRDSCIENQPLGTQSIDENGQPYIEDTEGLPLRIALPVADTAIYAESEGNYKLYPGGASMEIKEIAYSIDYQYRYF